MDLSMLVASKELHPVELTVVQANNELLHFCQCLMISTTISKENYSKQVTPVMEQKYTSKQDLSVHLDYRRAYFWHIFSLINFDCGANRIAHYELDFDGYLEKNNMEKTSNRRYKKLVESCIDILKLIGFTFNTLEESKLEGEVTLHDPTPEECRTSEGNVVQASVELTLSSDESAGVLDDDTSSNNLCMLTDIYHEEPVSPEISLSKELVDVGYQQGQVQRKEIAIGFGNVVCDTAIGDGIITTEHIAIGDGIITTEHIAIGDGIITTKHIGIGDGIITTKHIAIGDGIITTKHVGIGTGFISTGDKGNQCEIPQLVVQKEIGCQYIEPKESINFQVDQLQVALPAECNDPREELLFDHYISDSANHQTLNHKGKSYKFVLVRQDNLNVITYADRKKLINDWITVNIVGNRNSFYSCKIHRGGCTFVNIKTRSKSTVDNHVQSYLMYMVCILCKKK